MPIKKKNIIQRKVLKQTTKPNSASTVANKNNTAQNEPTTTSNMSCPKKSADNQIAYDKVGVRRLYTPFNKFGRTAALNKSKSVAPHSPYRSSGLSCKEKSYLICSCQSRSTRYISLKELALKAIKDHKIFTIYGICGAIRQALLERGWVEKMPSHRMNLSKIRDGVLSTKTEIHTELERLLLSNFVEKCEPNFIWRTSDIMPCGSTWNPFKDTLPLENKLGRSDTPWTSKQGLCSTIKRYYWFYIEDVSEVTCPRSYNTYDSDDIDDFTNDFKITACTSLLKWVLSMVANERPVFTKEGKISLNLIVFALSRCKEYLFRKQNRDIDQNVIDVSAGQWRSFLKKYYHIIGREDVFRLDRDNKLPLYLAYARFILKEIYRYRPQLSCEGCLNIWIIKPAHNSRGRGIRMASKLGVITNLLNKANSKYVIQKYIEEPLLIYETKFDIRQYYLVTSTYPLTIWMYKDCYLKFSSQKYNLLNYHEAIHLTNNAVQKRYTNCADRHSELPRNNMWDSDRYKNYLSNIGKGQVWDHIIYPGMKKSIIGIMLSCQDNLIVSKNRFELYGCDFVVDKMYRPWLLEINACPDFNHTTSVTAKICPAVLADVIKVVIDYPRNKKCSTGKFECIYQQPMTHPKPAPDLAVRGYTLPNSYFYKGAIPTQRNIFESNFEIDKAENMMVIMKKMEHFYELENIMVEPDDNVIEVPCPSPTRRKTSSDDELSMAAAVITTQLEELIDRITIKNTDETMAVKKSDTIVTSISAGKSIKSLVNLVTLIRKSITGLSKDGKKRITKSTSGTFKFNEFDSPGPVSKANEKVTEKVKEIFDDFKDNELKHNHIYNEDLPNSNAANSKTKNIIREATSEILNFIDKKEKEYFKGLL